MFNKLSRKFAKAVLAGSMLVGTMATTVMSATPIFAQWPDPGYNHIAAEDKTFSTNDEAFTYAQKESYSIYKKYNCAIEYEVVYDGPGKFRAVFYGYGYNGGSGNGTLSKAVKFQGKVNCNELNVRSWAGTQYECCSFSPLHYGDVVDVCDSVGDWYYICYKGLYGFVYSPYIDTMTNPAKGVVFRAVVTANELNVRSDAGTEYTTVNWGPLTQNMMVNVLDSKRDKNQTIWYLIDVNGKTGFISSDYVTRAEDKACQDVAPDAAEKAFAGNMQLIPDETRFFRTEQAAVNWARSDATGNYLYNKYGKTVYFYVADVDANCFVVHLYK